MKRSITISHKAAWILLGSVPLAGPAYGFAQSSGSGRSFGVMTETQLSPKPASAIVLTAAPQASACPVALRAQHLADGSMVRTSHDTHPKGVGQWLHLTVANPEASQTAGSAKQVTGALITVHGFADVPRMTEAAAAAETRADTQRTILVPFPAASSSSAAGQAAGADVWVPGMTAVTLIELKSLSYADGSQWSLAGGGSCRITPDPLMLIAGK
jgi:hypothetical protein